MTSLKNKCRSTEKPPTYQADFSTWNANLPSKGRSDTFARSQ